MEKEFAEDPFGYRLYGMELDHRHVPEITRHAGLAKSPIFMPAVAGHPRGTLVQIPMDLAYLGMTYDELLQCLKSAYAGTSVAVHAGAPGQFIDPARMAGSDIAELFILGERSKSQVVLTAVFDNLGKGAAGAAEMNLCLMLGI
jgi:N-acetyl-gamma-glutamyl-phosphate reductase